MINNQTIQLIKEALKEDVGAGDITTSCAVGCSVAVCGNILAKEAGVICGLGFAKEVFRQVDKKIKFTVRSYDGAKVKKGQVVATVCGPARGILIGERLALNFLQHLSGVATLTSKYVARVKGTRCLILDTRKTMPLWRNAQKFAIKCGGGTNHRMGLWDAVLIKDNHIALAGGIGKTVVAAKLALPRKKIEAEAKTISQVRQAISAGADIILLDNMNLKTLRKGVKLCKKAKVRTEASGGVTLRTIRAIAKTGVDSISVGALTHSAKALDLSLSLIS